MHTNLYQTLMECYNKDLLVPSLAVPNFFEEKEVELFAKKLNGRVGKLETQKNSAQIPLLPLADVPILFKCFPPKLQRPYCYKGKLTRLPEIGFP